MTKQLNTYYALRLFQKVLVKPEPDWVNVLRRCFNERVVDGSYIDKAIQENDLSLDVIRDYALHPEQFELIEAWRGLTNPADIQAYFLPNLSENHVFKTTVEVDEGFNVFNASIKQLDNGTFKLDYAFNNELSKGEHDNDGSCFTKENHVTYTENEFNNWLVETLRSLNKIYPNERTSDSESVRRVFVSKGFIFYMN